MPLIKGIDYDRGVMLRKDSRSGMSVYMYIDTPGVYLNIFGKEISEEVAALAGYPVEELKKRRLRSERMEQAMGLIESELGIVNDPKQVIEERDGYQLLKFGDDRFVVKDETGNSLTPYPIPESSATSLFRALAPEKKAPRAKAE